MIAKQDVPPITNLGADLSNGVVIIRLLNTLFPEKYDLKPLSIVSNAERLKVVAEYCKYAELEHIVDQKALQEGSEAKLGLAVEVLYQQSRPSQLELLKWINAQLGKAKHFELQKRSVEVDARQMLVLFSRCMGASFADAFQMELPEVLKLAATDFQTLEKNVQKLLQSQKIDYVSAGDILRPANQEKLLLLVNLMYKPLTDFSKLDALPTHYLISVLHKANPKVKQNDVF